MTETECYSCDYVDNCDWNLIVANNCCISVPCVARIWHKKSLKTFNDMKYAIRAKIDGGGEVVKACTKTSSPVRYKGIDEIDDGWT